MAIKVTFNAQKVLGQDFTIIDTMSNVQKAAKGYEKLLDAIDELEQKNAKKSEITPLYEYGNLINEYTVKNVASLLGLNKAQTKKLENMSRSEIAEFYAEVVEKFCQMTVPSVKAMNDYRQALIQANLNPANDETSEDEGTKDPK
ncbi:hypothetical protein [uncultured Lactobacillus sp.]|uniref:hypothetical protein n=1 Tax=uncultured Lactobacillus sp. TaxID=153152 RepID=UPI00260F6E2B|nr:hypothetical protein [uncultured Lactobacillus sp.]